MGTRHQQMVINQKGEIKLSQYGQWDGYPSGQGKDILTYQDTPPKNHKINNNN